MWTHLSSSVPCGPAAGQSRDTPGGVRKEAASGDPEGNIKLRGACNGNGELWASQKVTHSDGLEVLVSGEESGHR